MLEAIEWQLESAQPFPKWDWGSVDCRIHVSDGRRQETSLGSEAVTVTPDGVAFEHPCVSFGRRRTRVI